MGFESTEPSEIINARYRKVFMISDTVLPTIQLPTSNNNENSESYPHYLDQSTLSPTTVDCLLQDCHGEPRPVSVVQVIEEANLVFVHVDGPADQISKIRGLSSYRPSGW